MSIKNSRLILFSIFIISIVKEGGSTLIDYRPAQSITLEPVENNEVDFLKTVSLEKRQGYCRKALDTNSIGIPVIATSNLQNYIPAAHKYKFDDEEMLAIRCPTIPALYVSEDELSIHIRTLRPKIYHFKFNFEVATKIDPVTNAKFRGKEDTGKREISEGMTIAIIDFFDIDVSERWYLCVEALKFIRYKIEWEDVDKIEYIEEPRFYSFKSSHSDSEGQSQTFLAFQCPSKQPTMFLRFGSTDEDKIIWIVLESNSDLPNREIPKS